MAEALKAVEDLVRLSSRVIRILGQNPGPYTLSGTNTYLVSSPFVGSLASLASRPSILVDTGEGTGDYIPLLEKALKGASDGSSTQSSHDADRDEDEMTSWVSDIILTHKHHDHVGGLPGVLSLLSKLRAEASVTLPAPRIHKFADPASDPQLVQTLQGLPKGSFVAYDSQNGTTPLWPLTDGSRVSVTGPNEGSSTLQVVHTPGHTMDHICLLLADEKTLLTGDHVLGQGTTVFEDLTHYMSSLRKCSKVLEEIGTPDGAKDNLLYPAHGPVVKEGRQMLLQYLQHRLQREEQVLELLRTSPDGADEASSRLQADENVQLGAPWKIRQMVLKMYSNYPENLFAAASRGLFLHLRALSSPDAEQKRPSLVRCLQNPSFAQGQSNSDPGNSPPLPQNYQEWLEVVDLEWSLILSSPSSQQQRL